jgi:trigger factor
MAITTKKIDTANATIEAKITQEKLHDLENKIAQNAAKDMKVDGFRKGKVPAHVVKARYGDKLQEDAKNEAIREVYEEALKELNLEPTSIIGEPRVSKFEEKDDEIEVEIEIALRPEIKLEGYKELIPEIKTPDVEDKEIEDRINDMLKSSAPIEKIKRKRALKSGDHTLIDFEGFLDGEPFAGGKADGYNLEIGSGSFIPGFEDQMIGMKPEETKEINVTFPEEYQSADLAGKEVMFKVTLLEIQEKVVPEEADEEMLKKFLPNEEAPSKEKLLEAVKKQITAEKESKIFQEETKPKFVEELVRKYKIDLPKGIVEQEMDMAFRNALSTMTEDDIKKYTTDADAAKEKREEYRSDAEDSVKLTFIVDELAKQEGVDVNDQEVMQAIYMEAFQSGQEPQAYLKQYEDQGLLPAVKMAIIEDKLFTKLFNESKEEKK